MKFTSLFYLLLVVFAGSCVKEVTELPPATQTGANTFGCRVNGELWVPAGFGIIPTAAILEARMNYDHTLIINARNFSRSPTETEFEIQVRNVTGPGEYLLNSQAGYPPSGVNYAYYVRRRFTPLNEWVTTPQYSGRVFITKVETGANAICSGTFEFDASSIYDSTNVAHISEGRFDVRVN